MKTKTDPHIEELIDKELAEHGYTRSDFSKKEIAELRSEIIAKENGASILDGFWSRVGQNEFATVCGGIICKIRKLK